MKYDQKENNRLCGGMHTTPNWYCVREVYADGDLKAVGNGTLKRCETWVLGMQTLLEVKKWKTRESINYLRMHRTYSGR